MVLRFFEDLQVTNQTIQFILLKFDTMMKNAEMKASNSYKYNNIKKIRQQEQL